MKEDSIEGIYDTLKQTAIISKCAGGIGLAVHNIRASGSYIRGTNGHSNGLIPMLRVYNTVSNSASLLVTFPLFCFVFFFSLFFSCFDMSAKFV